MECGTCTLCCKLLDIPWMDSPVNTLCSHCNEGEGCLIFVDVDDRCKQFKCSYNQVEKINIALRPDNCHIIFEKLSSRIFFGTPDPAYPLLPVAKGQIASFNKQGYSVLLSAPRPLLFKAKEHNAKEIEKEYNKIVGARYGSCNL